MKWSKVMLFLTVVFLTLVGCAGKPEKDRARPTERKSFSERLNENNGYKQDEAGNWVPRTDKRSPYESIGDSPYFTGTQKKKEFKTGEFQGKSWWGSRDFKVKAYQGDTDGSHFHSTARQQGMAAREGGGTVDLPGAYTTGNYATGTAREAGAATMPHAVDAETDVRRRVYGAPEVLNWNERRAISREETKSLLGR